MVSVLGQYNGPRLQRGTSSGYNEQISLHQKSVTAM